MRALVVSDIHANLAAYEAVLRDTEGKRDTIFCLGDIVGYGPYPNECVQRVMETAGLVILGNHDLAASGKLDISYFSARARKAMEWTRKRITDGSLLAFASHQPIAESGGILFSHGDPADPVWGYILDSDDAATAFRERKFGICLVGHTHTSAAFSAAPYSAGLRAAFPFRPARPSLEAAKDLPFARAGVELFLGDCRWILNPGSVGFPRTAEEAPPREGSEHAIARYALLDTETLHWKFMKTEYDMRATARKMRDEGLW